MNDCVVCDNPSRGEQWVHSGDWELRDQGLGDYSVYPEIVKAGSATRRDADLQVYRCANIDPNSIVFLSRYMLPPHIPFGPPLARWRVMMTQGLFTVLWVPVSGLNLPKLYCSPYRLQVPQWGA